MAGNIFINYRREETGHVAGRLHDSLAQAFGRNKLFMDVDNIPIGRDFEDYLKSQVAACDAMLAVIGPNWVNAKNDSGQRRLDDPDDFVAIEIEAALARNIPLIPVLVDGARLPRASELPDSLKPLVRRQAIGIRHEYYRADAETLIAKLREAISGGEATIDKPQVADGPEPFGDKSRETSRWRLRAIAGVAAMVVLLLVGVAAYEFL